MTKSWLIAVPWVFVVLPLITFLQNSELLVRICLAIAISITAWGYSEAFAIKPINQEDYIAGWAYIEIDRVKQEFKWSKTLWNYSARIYRFTDLRGNIRSDLRLPCRIVMHDSTKGRLDGSRLYKIKGVLKIYPEAKATFKLDKDSSWVDLGRSNNLSEWRFNAKNYVRTFLDRHFSAGAPCEFLKGLVTGEFQDPSLARNLSRLGLQHIMAISGFHFSLLAGLFGFILGLCFSRSVSALITLWIMTAYLIFLGESPSILRAWTSISIALCGTLLGLRASGLNSLGAGVLVVLGISPSYCESIGFQLSFLVTLSILLGFPQCDAWLLKQISSVEIKDNEHERLFKGKMMNKLGVFFRQSLALMIAVNVVTIPASLFLFQQFPLISLLYNLFFPLLVSACMALLVCACCLSFIPYLSPALFHLCEWLTQFSLRLTTAPPDFFDKVVHMDTIPASFIVIYLSALIFFLGARWVDHARCNEIVL